MRPFSIGKLIIFAAAVLFAEAAKAQSFSGVADDGTMVTVSAIPVSAATTSPALAMTGLNKIPKNGYKIPAAMGTPRTL